MIDFRIGCALDRWWARCDVGDDLLVAPTFFVKEIIPAVKGWRDPNWVANYCVWDNGPRIDRRPILRVTDPTIAQALMIEQYHDYPDPDQFDQIDDRDCA